MKTSEKGDFPKLEKYKCHKIVDALRIVGVNNEYRELWFENYESPIVRSKEYFDKHKPVSGGFYVVYRDGYESFSPGDAFESGYTKINPKIEALKEEAKKVMINILTEIGENPETDQHGYISGITFEDWNSMVKMAKLTFE